MLLLSKRFCNEAVIITLMQTQTLVIAIEKVLLLAQRVIAMGRPLRRKPPRAKELLVVVMQIAMLVVVAKVDGPKVLYHPQANMYGLLIIDIPV